MSKHRDQSSEHEESLLRQFAQTFYALIPAFERYMGLSRARWQVLRQLNQDGEISQAQLQRRLRVDRAAITRQAKQLEDEGLVARRADPLDNRFTLISLTPAGHGLVSSLLNRRDDFERLVTDGLKPGELESIQRWLHQMRSNSQSIE